MAALDRIGGIASEVGLAIKAPCTVATTGANILLAGVQVVDGVTVGNANERVLVKDQADQTTNGIYIASSGTWTYAQDAGGNTDWSKGTLVVVQSGTVNGGSLFEQTCTDTPIVIGTSLLAFALYAATVKGGTGISVTGTNPTTVALAAGAVLPSVTEYGTGGYVVGSGGDDTAAFVACAAANAKFRVPPGSFNLNPGHLTLQSAGCGIIGDGTDTTIITLTGTGSSGIVVPAGATQPDLRNFKLTRSGTAVAGGTNLDLSGGVNEGCLEDLVIEKGYINLLLGPTDSGRVTRVTCQKGQQDGILRQNTASSGSLQWQFDDVLSTQNVGWGMSTIALNIGPSQITVGEDRSCQTFANSLGGKRYIGLAAIPINGIRDRQGFYGADGGDEIYLDTYNTGGNAHRIEAPTIELAGTQATGPSLGTAATNVGCGVKISANNGIVHVTTPVITNVSSDGIQDLSTAGNYTGQGTPLLEVIGGSITNVGLGGNVSLARGIASVGSGSLIAIGVRIGNIGSNTTQQYGITMGASTVGNVVIGNNLNGNTTLGLLNASTDTTNVIEHNLGYNPIGVTAAATIGASPATITAGPTRETHYVNQSATNTATIAKGGQKIATLAGSSTYYIVELGPNESYVVTWATTAPTYTKDVH